jgi:hypothetical protein
MTNWKIYARTSAVKLSTKIVEIIWGKWKWWFNDTDETAEVSVFYGEDIVFKFKKVLDVPVETVLIKKNFFEFQSTLSADEW